jgi:hypothetical protein
MVNIGTGCRRHHTKLVFIYYYTYIFFAKLNSVQPWYREEEENENVSNPGRPGPPRRNGAKIVKNGEKNTSTKEKNGAKTWQNLQNGAFVPKRGDSGLPALIWNSFIVATLRDQLLQKQHYSRIDHE